jgi:hypothetical protein
MATTSVSVAEPSQHKQIYSRKTTKNYPVNSLTAQIGRTIRRIRTNKDMILRDLSLSSFIALGHLSEIETGQKNASPHTIESVCKGLGITTLEFHRELCITIEKGW